MKYGIGKNPNSRNGFKYGHKINVGRILSLETRQKLSILKKGKPSKLLGRKYSEEHRRNISLNTKGKKHKPLSKETKMHMSLARKGKKPKNLGWLHIYLKNKSRPDVTLRQLGDKNPAWRGGLTKLQKRLRSSSMYKQWRNIVFERDNWTCSICNIHGGSLQADHFPKTFSLILKENKLDSFMDALLFKPLWNIDNGRTLCLECHKTTHVYMKKDRERMLREVSMAKAEEVST